MNAKKTMQSAIEKIATEVLGLETLETRKMDNLDFHDMSVWQIKKALEAAYAAGMLDNAARLFAKLV